MPKLLIVTSSYPRYLEGFYSGRPGLSSASFREQKDAYDHDAFGWASCWSDPLALQGYQVTNIVWNVEPMQRAWAKESGRADFADLDLKQIALLQAKEMQPDLLWFDDYDRAFLNALRQQVPSIRGVLGWVGSALPKTDIWRQLDLILSCAPESVATLKGSGFPVACFPHSFDARVIDRLVTRPKSVAISFVGQLTRVSDFHLQRDALLERLADEVPLEIHSPSAFVTRSEELKTLVKIGVCHGMQVLRGLGVPISLLREVPVLGIVAGLSPEQCRPVNPRLAPFLKPALFGLSMYQLVADSLLTLNIHADSSPDFASNMRLFEVTGAGSCLVTDWKQNLHELFEPDSEAVVFKTAEECVEKVKWLLDNRKAAEEISRAGQRRTLNNYTFVHRAGALAVLLDKVLSGRAADAGRSSS